MGDDELQDLYWEEVEGVVMEKVRTKEATMRKREPVAKCAFCGDDGWVIAITRANVAVDPPEAEACPHCEHGKPIAAMAGAKYELGRKTAEASCELRFEAERARPVPMLLTCPVCGTRHVDEGTFATKPHHTHACQSCGTCWRPAIVATVGVRFLPGFKDEKITVTASFATATAKGW